MPIKFSWLLNGRNVEDVVGINMGSFGQKTSFLGIDALSEEHAGNYTCIAENRVGFASYSAVLIVKGTFVCLFIACRCVFAFNFNRIISLYSVTKTSTLFLRG